MSLLSRLFASPLKLSQNLGAYPLQNGDISPLFIFFGVRNRSGDEVEITSVRVQPKGEEEPLPVDLKGDVPARISAGDSVRYEVRAKVLAEASRVAGHTGTPKLTLVATDGEGKEHRHDFTLRVDEYIALKDE